MAISAFIHGTIINHHHRGNHLTIYTYPGGGSPTYLRISQLPLRLRLGGKSPRLTIPLLSLPPLQLHYHHYQPPPYHPRIPSHFNIGTMKMDRMMVRTNPCACLDVQTTVLSNSPYSSKIWFLQNLVSFLDITIR